MIRGKNSSTPQVCVNRAPFLLSPPCILIRISSLGSCANRDSHEEELSSPALSLGLGLRTYTLKRTKFFSIVLLLFFLSFLGITACLALEVRSETVTEFRGRQPRASHESACSTLGNPAVRLFSLGVQHPSPSLFPEFFHRLSTFPGSLLKRGESSPSTTPPPPRGAAPAKRRIIRRAPDWSWPT